MSDIPFQFQDISIQLFSYRSYEWTYYYRQWHARLTTPPSSRLLLELSYYIYWN